MTAGISSAHAAWKPTDTVTIVVPFGPGGSADRTARMIHRILTKEKIVDAKIVVVNKGGGGTAIGTRYLAKQKKNPHYLLIGANPLLGSHILGRMKLTYTDLTPIARLMDDYFGMIVKADSKFKNLKDFQAALRANPKGASFGVSSKGGSNHASLGLVLKGMGIDVRNTKIAVFKGGGKNMTAVLGGHVDMIPAPPAKILPQIQAGKVRILGLTSPTRLNGAAFKNVPTFKEQGVDVVFSSWRGVFTPKGITADQRTYWEGVFKKMTESKDFRATLAKWQSLPNFMTGKKFETFLVGAYKDLKKTLLDDLGLKEKKKKKKS
ncbi:MAG: tripartite tricarboxylate transporter substrate binding protein [Proteobacteria bacterium]|nr:tripartite tricarboxylate transporter substrate binding protein [Pseudomonadota bacterium]